MKSAKQQIFEHIKQAYPDWVMGAELERIEFRGKNGTFKASTISRGARNLEETSNRIEKDYYGASQTVRYRYVPSKYEIFHQNYQNIV